MSLDLKLRLQPWASCFSAVSLLATISYASAAPLCTPLIHLGDFARQLTVVNKSLSRADNICYAEASEWMEQNPRGLDNVTLAQRFDYFRPTSTPLTQQLPLVIWAHPSGDSENIATSSTRFTQLVVPALQQNFAFMSLEFRHPVTSQLAPPAPTRLDIPNTDISRAVQWARAMADELGIDPKNIFLVGQSRGTLGLLTALTPNLANGDGTGYLTQSSRVSAAYAVQAQTTYQKDQIRKTFIHADDQEKFSGQYPDFIKPGSAINQISTNDPPLALRYERAPTDPLQHTVVPLHLRNDDKTCSYPQDGCFDVHHPNFGLKLQQAFAAAYISAGQTPPASKFDIAYNLPADNFFVDPLNNQPYVCFFVKHLTPAALANQTPAALAACGQ